MKRLFFFCPVQCMLAPQPVLEEILGQGAFAAGANVDLEALARLMLVAHVSPWAVTKPSFLHC